MVLNETANTRHNGKYFVFTNCLSPPPTYCELHVCFENNRVKSPVHTQPYLNVRFHVAARLILMQTGNATLVEDVLASEWSGSDFFQLGLASSPRRSVALVRHRRRDRCRPQPGRRSRHTPSSATSIEIFDPVQLFMLR